MTKIFKKFTLPVVLLFTFGAYYYFGGNKYLNLSQLADNYQAIQQMISENPWEFYGGFWLAYFLSVAFTLPLALILTIAAGIFFNIWLALALVVSAATLGALLLMILAQSFFESWQSDFIDKIMAKIRDELQASPWSYGIFLRLVPIFPFIAVNLALAFLKMDKKIFFATTLLGIIPGSYMFLSVAGFIGEILQNSGEIQAPKLGTEEFIQLALLAIFAILPVAIKKIRKK